MTDSTSTLAGGRREGTGASLPTPRLAALVRRLDTAVEEDGYEAICAAIESALTEAVTRGDALVPDAFHEPVADGYARRLLHRDPAGRYTVICMTWGPGQGTPLHDHGDSWGSVCVYAGRVRVTPYSIDGAPDGDLWALREEGSLEAPRGAVSSVIPPGDHHTIENPFDDVAMSIHVYRGEMQSAGVYVATDRPGVYRRESRPLSYDA